jgi:hypothetical protein
MNARIRAALPLATAVAVLTFLWVEVALNFTFHWNSDGALGNGLSLPSNFHLVAPIAFVSWAMFFAAGADSAAAFKALAGSWLGALGAFILMLTAPVMAEIPKFWGIAVAAGAVGFAVVLGSTAGDWYFTPAVFGGFASVVVWWIATGLDGWVDGGGGVGNSVKALSDPSSAGTGAFGGVLSTPAEWVFVSIAATLACGVFLGWLSVKIAGLVGSLFTGSTSSRARTSASAAA